MAELQQECEALEHQNRFNIFFLLFFSFISSFVKIGVKKLCRQEIVNDKIFLFLADQQNILCIF